MLKELDMCMDRHHVNILHFGSKDFHKVNISPIYIVPGSNNRTVSNFDFAFLLNPK